MRNDPSLFSGLLGRMLGDWLLSRRIAGAPVSGQISGRAVVSGNRMAARYREEGILSLPGQRPIHVMREYLWEQTEDGILVRFTDGRAFHEIGPTCQARHECAPDLYEVDYSFSLPDSWKAQWRVQGPRKAYSMMTIYRRP